MLKTSPRARDLISLVSQFLPGQGTPAAASSPRPRPAAHPLPGPSPRPVPAASLRAPSAVSAVQHQPQGALTITVATQIADPVAEQARSRGQFLARQERWQDLSGLIRAADTAREAADGALPLADLIAYGARADVVGAAAQALDDDAAAGGRGLIRGVMEFEALRAGHSQDPYLTALVALAHADIAQAWHRRGPAGARACAAHFSRASALLAPLSDGAAAARSPFLQAAECAVLATRDDNAEAAAESYARLIALDPRNPRPMRALGPRLLPAGGGSYRMLESEARRTAAATAGTWGAGGYAWVWADALCRDPRAGTAVDADWFVQGLRDILAADPSQEIVNSLAAYCTLALPGAGASQPEGGAQRRQIAAAAHWLVRDHLRTLHPEIWAAAAGGSAPYGPAPQLIARGESLARAALAELFAEELARGEQVVIGSTDPERAAG